MLNFICKTCLFNLPSFIFPPQQDSIDGLILKEKTLDMTCVHDWRLNSGQVALPQRHDSIHANLPGVKACEPPPSTLLIAKSLIGPSEVLKRSATSDSFGTYLSRKDKLLNSFSHPRSCTGLVRANSPTNKTAHASRSWARRNRESMFEEVKHRRWSY